MTRRDKIGEHAYIRYVLEVAWLYVKLGQNDLAQEYLDEVKCLMDEQSITSSVLYSVYYRVSTELFRVCFWFTIYSRLLEVWTEFTAFL